jgi:TP901 family phage tail tape measure protein
VPDNDYRLSLAADLSSMERGLARITNQLAGVVGGLNETDSAIKRTESTSKTAAQSQNQFSTSLNTTRYALYDVSRTMTLAGVALLGLSVLPTKVAISFQREFANVSRTVQGASDVTKTALIDLSNTIPVSFKNLTEIATLGGQLGISASGITQFTSTVAKLTATTNLSADAAGTALGRFKSFGLVTADQFENLASAILKVGVNSVATESQIVNIATGIAGIGKVAGLSAATLIGYAGSLASVGVQQYAARGTTQRFLSLIQTAATDGGEKLNLLAKISGYSADTIRTSFGTDKFNPVFQSIIKNLGDTSRTGTDLNTTLKDLGINSVIDQRTLLQLAAAPGVVSQAFKDAASGIKSAGELNRQYNKIAETTSARIEILNNNFQSLMNTIGQSTLGPANFFVGGLTDIAKTLTELSSTGAGQVFLAIGAGASALAGALALVGGVAARGSATLIGMITALRGLNAESATSNGLLALLRTELEATGTAGKIASVGIGVASAALKGLLVIGAVVAVSQFAGWLTRMGDNAASASLDVDKLADTTVRAGQKVSAQTKELDRFTRAASALHSSLTIVGGSPADQTINQINNRQAQSVTGINGAFTQKGSPLKAIDDLLGGFPGHVSGLDQARESVDKIDKALASLVKSGNITAASQAMTHLLATSGGQGLNFVNFKEFMAQFPEYKKALEAAGKAADAASKANEALDKSAPVNLVKTLKDLTGLDDKGLGKFADAYAKSVAPLTDFNNIVKQVQQSQADAIAAQQQGISLADYQAKAVAGQAVSLQAFTDQLNTNNAAQQTWATNLITLSAQAGPAAAQPFIDAGYSAVNASILQQLVDATPAQRDAYVAAQVEAAQLASEATAQAILASGFIVTASGDKIGKDTAAKLGQGIQLGLPVEAIMQSLNLRFSNNPLVPSVNVNPAQNAIDGIVRYGNNQRIQIPVSAVGNAAYAVNPGGRMIPQGATGGLFMGDRFKYSTGGPVRGRGSGTSDEVPAWLSNGEYVIKASRVRQLGTGFLDGLNGGRSNHGAPRYAGGGQVNQAPSMGVTELGPTSLGVLRQAIHSEVAVYLGDEHIARSSNKGNARMNARGAN